MRTANCAIRSGRLARALGHGKSPRRQGRAVMRARRGIGRLRRKTGVAGASGVMVHDGEREIIARN